MPSPADGLRTEPVAAGAVLWWAATGGRTFLGVHDGPDRILDAIGVGTDRSYVATGVLTIPTRVRTHVIDRRRLG
jgi:hypothetical protein